MLAQGLLRDGAQVGIDGVALGFGLDGSQKGMVQCGDAFPLIIEVIGGVAAQAHEVRLVLGLFGGQGLFGLHIVDVFPDFLRSHFLVEVAVRQQKHRPQLIVAEIAAGAFHGFFVLAIAVNHTLDTLGGNVVGVVHHFYQDEFAVTAICLVHIEYGMGSSTRTGERVENDRIGVCRKLKNSS